MSTKLPKVPAVIVGMGWAGGIIAAELTKAGIPVVGLERGKERTTNDYLMGHDELRFQHRTELMQDLSKETITHRNNPNMRALPMRSYGTFIVGDGVGGAGSHWNGQTYRFLPYDFEIKTLTEEKYGANKLGPEYTLQDWGMTYDEIEPYYDTFEKMAGISGETVEMYGHRSNPYPTGPMVKTPTFELFEEATKKFGYHPYMIPSGNLSENYTNPDGIARGACQYCAYCENFGCEYGAKADPVVTVIPVAKETGNLDLRTHSNVTQILNDGTKATGVVYVNTITGEEFEQPADVVIVTSYVFNNVRLLLNSNIGTPYNPETGEGSIGKNYCYQVSAGATTLFYDDKSFNNYAGAGALGIEIPDFAGDNFDHSDVNFIHGSGIRMTQYGNRPIAINHTPSGTPSWGAEFKKQSIKYANSTLQVKSQGASIPHKDNYLDLDPEYKDAYGMPLLRMTYDYTEQDKELVKYMAKVTRKIAEEIGADHYETSEEQAPFNVNVDTNTHNTGGVIMGADPETSAVNSYLQMWEAENVFVIGASAFPHNSSFNPTGTIGALSYRASEGIIKYLEDGGGLLV
ncbi:GMC family oxidoreductase [Oceanobacillus polygoni]|uniref:Gluconate 2-dehydrogenase alpha chain n=1 Tax=Oceanobacillus polygoni TaxID=1235259 RepID=A0A9X0YUE9_9BACI|nr:GMC family oxidoreductase [Oceanobacillus polygoni]MBP2078829.1 gluconate 2-dehydrogenase alpha chain [Oceanobacillus polygoni]